MPILHIVVASTRPGRRGPAVAAWFLQLAQAHAGFEPRLVDLAEVNLPLLDEPAHPRLRQYLHQHTRDWSALVEGADAFVFVTPEYNYGVPAPLVNALDYLHQEWAYKPVGFVSYGGQSGGIRAVQMAKQIVAALKMMPLPEGVAVPFFNQHFDEAGAFQATEAMGRAATTMLDELRRWAAALAPMREKAPTPAAMATPPAAATPPTERPFSVAPAPAATSSSKPRGTGVPSSPRSRGTRH